MLSRHQPSIVPPLPGATPEASSEQQYGQQDDPPRAAAG
jgi:hypothetical protein